MPRNHLRAPITLVSAGGQWELDAGDLFIGRDSAADVILDDPLASRFHARLTVGPDAKVRLEDLQSANGITVNGVKLTQPSTFLGDGDSLLIGTTELSVFALRRSSIAAPKVHDAREQQSSVDLATQSNAPIAERDEPWLSRESPTVTIGRPDAIDLVGRFAEELMDSGHPLEAQRVLSEHLQNLLKGASAGLSVPATILASATHCALRLQGWMQRTEWIGYVFELHLACLQVPSEASLDELEDAMRASPDVDPRWIAFFARMIERRPEPLTPEESLRLLRIGLFARASSSKSPPPVE